MTEWWLRKAVICHLSPIFCNYYFIRDGIPTSPLTRSVGSVTSPYFSPFFYLFIFQLTRSVGSVTDFTIKWVLHRHNFNSHAPWGAWRDLQLVHYYVQNFNSHAPWGAWPIADITRTPLSLFQLTRSVGSVTAVQVAQRQKMKISTHTLRGERDTA